MSPTEEGAPDVGRDRSEQTQVGLEVSSEGDLSFGDATKPRSPSPQLTRSAARCARIELANRRLGRTGTEAIARAAPLAGRAGSAPVAGVGGVAEEVGIGGELEAGGLDLRAHRLFLDAVQGLPLVLSDRRRRVCRGLRASRRPAEARQRRRDSLRPDRSSSRRCRGRASRSRRRRGSWLRAAGDGRTRGRRARPAS